MSDDLSPVARALLGGSPDAPDRDVPCCVCGEITSCPGFVWAAASAWNREEAELAQGAGRPPRFITGRDLGVACEGECNSKNVTNRHAEVQRENETTMAYLSMLAVGNYNPESLAWLRQHGHAARVAKVLAKEGTSRAHA